MSGESDEIVSHDTHRILNEIGKDIFQCNETSVMDTKLSAYEKCLLEIRERVDNEIEARVDDFWRGVK